MTEQTLTVDLLRSPEIVLVDSVKCVHLTLLSGFPTWSCRNAHIRFEAFGPS
jgi:hypothetical protein